jgi:hypothetical protein
MKRIAIALIGFLVVNTTLAGEIDKKGSGTISAQGKGVVKFMGSGKIDITGDGLLWVVDCSMDYNLQVMVTGKGERVDKTPAFIYAYKGLDGTASINGGPMKLVLTGKGEFAAKGKGKIILKGVGTYKIDDQKIPWTEDIETEIILEEKEAQK